MISAAKHAIPSNQGWISAGSAQAANTIGDGATIPKGIGQTTLNTYTQAIAHAIAGCAGGAAAAGNGGGCGAGAIGAVVGELTAQYASSSGMTDPAAITALARVMSATAGLLVSNGDASAVNVAASMGANAAENNALAHRQANALAIRLKISCAGDAQCINNAISNATALSAQQGSSVTPSSANAAISILGQLANDPSIALNDANRTAIANLTNKNVSDYYVAPTNIPSSTNPNQSNTSSSNWSYMGANSSGVPGNISMDNRSASEINQAGQNLAVAMSLAPIAIAATAIAPAPAIAAGVVNVGAQAIQDEAFNPTSAVISTITGGVAGNVLTALPNSTTINTAIGAAANTSSYAATNVLTGQPINVSGAAQAAVAGGAAGNIANPAMQAIASESLGIAIPVIKNNLQNLLGGDSR